ncbi:MAG: UbiX family flavin prenyltransferase [Planctomycetaceae bacterium]|nr:UbiX family flavin prenyltransferase [Planctomycetaceae bacterium]
MSASDIVVAVTGASGVIYARRLVNVLLEANRTVHLVLSPAAGLVCLEELGVTIDFEQFDPRVFLDKDHDTGTLDRLKYHHYQDFNAGIASGSFRTAGMVICPCSMGTLGSLANGMSTNLIHRVADVHLKERRKIVIVPRETPLSSIQLENMKRLVDAGAVLLPAMPGFYLQPQSIDDLVDFIISRICDHLEVDVQLTKRWGSEN